MTERIDESSEGGEGAASPEPTIDARGVRPEEAARAEAAMPVGAGPAETAKPNDAGTGEAVTPGEVATAEAAPKTTGGGDGQATPAEPDEEAVDATKRSDAKVDADERDSAKKVWGPGSSAPVTVPGGPIPRAPEPATPVAPVRTPVGAAPWPGGPTPWVRPVPRWRLVPCPPGVLPAAGAAGLVAAITISLDRPGIGWLIAGIVAVAVVFVVDLRARRAVTSDSPDAGTPSTGESADGEAVSLWQRVWCHRERIWWTGVCLGLLAVGVVRAAGWLFVLCVIAALVAASLAVVGRRSARGAWFDVVAVPLSAVPAVPWAYRRAQGMRGNGKVVRIGWSVVVTVLLLAVLIPLLGSADAAFGALVDDAVPEIATDSVVRASFLFVAAAAGALGALYLLAGPVPVAPDGTRTRALRRVEWALPMGALTVLFAVFVAVQFVAMFGGDDYVQRTSGLTYAEYARTGFWQLSIVSVLTLAVIMVVLRLADRQEAGDRRWLRALTGVVSLLSLVIVASALGRMWTYQQAYGFTVLRLLVEVCELWLGLVFLLVLIALPRLDLTRLPRAALGTAFATLLVLAVIDPERLIADRNIDRWQRGDTLDTAYLRELSPDILPALSRLPESIADPVRDSIRDDMPEDSWSSWNLSRARAR